MEAREYWDRHAEAFAGLYGQPTWFNRVFREALYLRAWMTVEAIQQTPAATVLDVGCGPGRNSVLFVKQGGAARVVGVDLAEEMLQMARHLAEVHGVADRCQFIRADFMDLDLSGQRFDYSAALGVMDYIRDPVPMLSRMRQLTRRQVLATFPGIAPVRMTLRRVRYALRGARVHGFGRGRIERMLAEAGFASWRVERCTRAGWMGVGLVDNASEEKRY